jgi:hypothetical protein
VLLGVLILAGLRGWPFDSVPQEIEEHESPSVWQYLFSDRFVLGYVRLTIVFGALFVVPSVTGLALARRWMSWFGAYPLTKRRVRRITFRPLRNSSRRPRPSLLKRRRSARRPKIGPMNS